jgi:hypothetical protein
LPQQQGSIRVYAKPTSPQTIGGVLDDAIKLYRESFRACWPVAAAAAVIMGALGVYLELHVLGAVLSSVRSASQVQVLNVYRQPSVYLVYLADAAVRLAATGAMLIYQNALADGEGTLSMREAIGVMFNRLIPGLLASVAWWVVIMVGFALLLVPGIYFLGALCLWPACLFIGGAGPLQALQQSRELVRGYWWRTTTILTVAVILVMVLSSVAGALVGAVVPIFHRDLVAMQLALQIVAVFVSVFTISAIPAALVAIYRDLTLRRDGSDLAARLGALAPG